jgi:hypothetical protein
VLRKAQGLDRGIGKVGRRVGLGLAGGITVGAGLAMAGIVASVNNALDAAKIGRVYTNTLKNLGAEGKAAFGGARGFAAKFGDQIGKDDDDILAVINKLGSFPGAFGKGALGADAMRRATAAAFDLESQGIGSAQSNIIGIGKALNNPIKGMSALARQGVSFTDAQKKQITHFVKQNQLAKAQAALLVGIESNAKGAAAAAASPFERLKATIGNISEDLGAAILPSLTKGVGQVQAFVRSHLPAIERYFAGFGKFLSAHLPGLIDTGLKFLGKIPGTITAVIDFAKSLPGTFATFTAAFGPLGDALGRLVGGGNDLNGLKTSGMATLNTLLTSMVRLLTRVVDFLADVKAAIDGTFGEGTAAKMAGIGLVLGALAGPIGTVVSLVKGIGGAFKIASAAAGVESAAMLAALGPVAVALVGLGIGAAAGTGIVKGGRKLAGKDAQGNQRFDDTVGKYTGLTWLANRSVGAKMRLPEWMVGAPKPVAARSTGPAPVTIVNHFNTQLTPRQQRSQAMAARNFAGLH